MNPSEDFVALLDMGVQGRFLSIGCRVVDDVLQWFDGKELHLVRGQVLENKKRKNSFEFQRAADSTILKFVLLSAEAFESRLRERYPDVPHDLDSLQVRKWLIDNYGLWPQTDRQGRTC
jgi:hypothetical protein